MAEWMQMFSYPFLTRALLAGVFVSLCAALLGVSLVLGRYSMIGDGLSHVAFGALSVSVALGLAPMVVTLPLVMLTAFLLLRLRGSSKLKGDAAIAIISSSALAIGVLSSALLRGANVDLMGFLFGSILSVNRQDLYLSAALALVCIGLYLFSYHHLFAVTFDESFARASGVRAQRYKLLLSLLTAVTVVVGMRLMGAMLISSLIIFPAVTAMRLCRSFRGVLICAVSLSGICFIAGLCLSYWLAAPAGASVVLVNLAAFGIFSLLGFLRSRFWG